jgi:hypothetical protein
MERTHHWWSGRLLELSEAECWELVATSPVGRIAWCEAGGPVVLPVNIGVDEGDIYVRTKPHTSLAAHVHEQEISIQVDDFEPFNQSGWSVLVRGRGEFVAYDLREPGSSEPDPWPEGARPLLIRLVPAVVTGRRLLAS